MTDQPLNPVVAVNEGTALLSPTIVSQLDTTHRRVCVLFIEGCCKDPMIMLNNMYAALPGTLGHVVALKKGSELIGDMVTSGIGYIELGDDHIYLTEGYVVADKSDAGWLVSSIGSLTKYPERQEPSQNSQSMEKQA